MPLKIEDRKIAVRKVVVLPGNCTNDCWKRYVVYIR
jgi:hypothetical protein